MVDAPFNRFEQVITRENELFSLGYYFQNIEDKVTELEQEVTIGNDD